MISNFFVKTDIKQDFDRINEILESDIFSSQNSSHPLVKSAFIEILICLRDLMYKAEKYSTRISFDNDVFKTNKVSDVSDLIKFVRDALCHPDIPHHYLIAGKIKATFCVIYGKGTLMRVDDIILKSDYDDDICFFFGEQKIYLKRHILRAYKEAKQKLLPII